MIFLIDRFGWAILAAALVGLLFEAVVGPGRGSLSSHRLIQALALATIPAGALVSGLRWVQGRPGLWLDAAILIMTGYALGCLIAAAIRGIIRARRAPIQAVFPSTDPAPTTASS